MAVAPTVLRPNGVASSIASWATYGAPSPNTLDQATKDNNSGTGARDAAFPSGGSGNITLELDMDTVAIPALAQVRSVTVRSREMGGSNTQSFGLRAGGTAVTWTRSSGGVMTTYSGPALTTRPSDGGAWTQADIDSLRYIHRSSNLDSVAVDIEEAYIDVLYNEAPVVSAITPSGTYTLTSRPPIGWTYSDPESDAQERYRVKIYQGTGTIADPDNTAAYVDSGEVFSPAITYTPPQALAAGSYRVYVKAADQGSNGRYSAWATGTFTIQIDSPGAPQVDAVPDSLLARIGITVQGQDNLLTDNQASLEVNATGWYVQGANTIARSTAAFLQGAASLAMTSTGTATMAARTADTSSAGTVISTGQKVVPGRLYTALASLRSSTVARQANVQIDWYGTGGAFISSTVGMRIETISTPGWRQAYASGVAPSGAAYAVLLVFVYAPAAAGEVHYVDAIDIGPTPVRNLLSANQGGFEIDNSSWVGLSSTIARSTAQALDGAASLAMTMTAAGGADMARSAQTNSPANVIATATPVLAGQSYTAAAWFRAATVGRGSIRPQFYWYTAAGAFISTSDTAVNVTDVTTTWGLSFLTATAPATAAFVAINLRIGDAGSAIGETHYVDRVRFFVSSINILTPQQASIEGVVGIEAKAFQNCTIARTTAANTFLEGAGAMAVTSVAAGTMTAGPTDQIADGMARCLPNTSYTAMVYAKAAVNARTTQLNIAWYTATGVWISTAAGVSANDAAGAWTLYTATATSPPTAAYAIATVQFNSTAAGGEVHYYDSLTLALTNDLTWLAGDRVSAASVVVEKSLDNGVTWTTVRGAAGGVSGLGSYWPAGPGQTFTEQTFTVYDYEIARNTPVLYRARILAETPFVTSSPNTQTAAVQHAATGWWLKDPLAPGVNIQLDVEPGFSFRRKEPQSKLEPVGRKVAVVITDGVRGIEGQLEVWTKDAARYAKVLDIIDNAHDLWLEDVLGRAWYVHFGDATEWSLLRAQPQLSETSPIRHLHSVALPFAEVGSPIGDTVLAGTPTG